MLPQEAPMEWNVVITTHDEGFERAERELEDLGDVRRTEFFNVLVMRVEDPEAFLRDVSERATLIPDLTDRGLSRVAPAQHTVSFRSAEEFEERAVPAVRELADSVAGSSFYVRVHRRGFGESLSSHDEERLLAGAIFDALEEDGETARVDFDDPDAVVVVEIVGPRAGISVWSRDQLRRYPFLDPG